MPWNTGGAVQGAAAGSTFGPWGAVIGGVAGGLLSGGGGSSAPTWSSLPNVPNIGSVSTPYGLAYRDPISGQMVYTSTANLSNIPNSLSNQMMSAAVMGRPTDTSAFNNQLAQLQAQLAQAKSATGATPNPATVGTGKFMLPSTQLFGGSANDPMVTELGQIIKRQEFGKQASYNADELVALSDWAKKYLTNKSGEDRRTWWSYLGLPGEIADVEKFANDYKTSSDNAKAAQQVVDQIQASINNVKDVQAGYAADPDWAKKNPILNWLNSGDTERYMNEQNAVQIQNQQKAAEDAMARKGLSRSTMADTMRAQLGYQQPQAMAAVHQQVGNQNYANRMNMLNYLSGQSQLGLNEELAKMGVSNQQMAQGQNLGMQYAQTDLSRLLAQYGLQGQSQMAQWNQNNLNNQLQNQQLWGGLGALGYTAGQQGWFRPSGSTTAGGGTSNYGLGTSNYGAGLGSTYGGNYGGSWTNWAGGGR